jgi:hypothetical protein
MQDLTALWAASDGVAITLAATRIARTDHSPHDAKLQKGPSP